MYPYDGLYGRASSLRRHLVVWGRILPTASVLDERCARLEVRVARLIDHIELASHADEVALTLWADSLPRRPRPPRRHRRG